MKMSDRLTRLVRKGAPGIGMWINLCDPGVAQIAGVVDYDWVMIDTEHNPLTESQVQGLLHALGGYDVQPIVRVRANRQEHISWVLDSGAGGVIIPGTIDAADARRAVDFCKYYPLGRRGYGPNRVSGFFTGEADYVKRANADLLLICQIELASAVAEVDEICTTSGVDGVWIGPTDLAQSMGNTKDGKTQRTSGASSHERLLLEIDDHVCIRAWPDHDSWELMETICNKIGPHPPGSPAMARARDLLRNRLEAAGAVDLREEEFPVRLWDPGECELQLLGPNTRQYRSLQHLYTASADLVLPLVDAGSGGPEDFERIGSRARESALIMSGFEISGGKFMPVISRILNAHEAGAEAIIFRNTEPIDLPALQVPDFSGSTDVPIPCMAVSGSTADELAAAASTGTARIRVKTTGSASPGTCANLIADIGPDDLPAETIILSAHLDSFWNAPGALDNLSGVATLYEIVRLLAPFRSHFLRKLRVIAFTAEELGFQGSKAYVARHGEELDDVRFVVNLDSLFPATARGTAVMWSPEMRDYIDRAFVDANRQVDVRNFYCSSSDYLPFMLEGVPACRPADWEDSFPAGSHTERDDLGNVRPDWIRLNAMVYAQLLARTLTDPAPLPARRLTPEEVRERIEHEDVAEGLRLMGFDVYRGLLA